MSGFDIGTIEADTHLSLTFCHSRTKKTTRVHVLSTDKTNVYALDRDGRKDYGAGEEFESFESSKDRSVHVFEFEAPGEWWLVIENRGDEEVSVSYEVMW